jgi:positive regulator of sigma E activity
MVQGTAIMPLIMFILIGSVTILEGPLSFTQGIVAVFIVAITGIAYIIIQRFNTG